MNADALAIVKALRFRYTGGFPSAIAVEPESFRAANEHANTATHSMPATQALRHAKRTITNVGRRSNEKGDGPGRRREIVGRVYGGRPLARIALQRGEQQVVSVDAARRLE
jgi:hypothetical protein